MIDKEQLDEAREKLRNELFTAGGPDEWFETEGIDSGAIVKTGVDMATAYEYVEGESAIDALRVAFTIGVSYGWILHRDFL